ncbi:MAG: ELM1/GtrOC1 family putative glycosyltransferase, partial [Pseudomonadota bacterium]
MSEATGSLGPSVWAVSDGRDGNVRQVQAIAHALSETQRWMQIAHIAGEGHRTGPLDLTPRAPFSWLPASQAVLIKQALPPDQRNELGPPWPNVWIGAGRRTAPYSKDVRGWSDYETLTVHILDPGIDPGNFDILVTPEHDGVAGDNVIATRGSPAYFAADDVEAAGLAFADLADERGRSAIIVLGGDSKTHTFDNAAADRLDVHIRAVASLCAIASLTR